MNGMKAALLVSLSIFSVGVAELGKEKARLEQRPSIIVVVLSTRHRWMPGRELSGADSGGGMRLFQSIIATVNVCEC
jgi:hypothetical protein